MSNRYIVNWEKDDTRGNVIRAGRTLKIKTRPATPFLAAVILKNYKRVGRNWKGSPVMVAQERVAQYDGEIDMKLKTRKGKRTTNIPKGKYLLKTWIADKNSYISRMYGDEFEIV